jgi:uncharacterized protein (TIGR00661 family)
MRIAYGVHGYGHGHASRAWAVMPQLAKRHEVLLLAGGDAYRALSETYPVRRLPTIGFAYRRPGQISRIRTMQRNLPVMLDVWLGGHGLSDAAEALTEFRADVVISDSEIFTHHAARRLGIPRITFDHFGLLAFCRPAMSLPDRIICRSQSMVYRMLYGNPDRAVVTGFFQAPARRGGVSVVGPVMRNEVLERSAEEGDYLLVYISKGDVEYTPSLDQAIRSLTVPVRVYGAPPQGQDGPCEFKPFSNRVFLNDLAGCRALIATTGNQLLGEALHFGKPVLGVPINCFEQRLNADQIARMGVGLRADKQAISTRTIMEFLERGDEFRRNMPPSNGDGAGAAVAALEGYAAELARTS